MPTYEFQCLDCGYVFEVFASISAKEKGLNLTCEKCGGTNIGQNVTCCQFYSPGAFKESTSVSSSSKCGGCHSGNCASCN